MKEDFKPARKRVAARIPAKRHLVSLPQAKKPLATDAEEPSFRPPEEIAAEEDAVPAMEEADARREVSTEPVKQARRWALPSISLPRGRKQWAIAVGVAAGLLLSAGGIYWFALRTPPPAPPPPAKVEVVPEEPPKPTTEPSKLTGLEIPIDMNQLPITGIMIENSPEARPQSGLKDAGIVFEAIAEGGITRFLALYQESQPGSVGPVRSVRPYYLDFLAPFDAAIAHAGGSGQALAEIRDQGIKDLDHGPNGGSFQRSSSRYAPHNLYTSLGQMTDLQKQKGYTSTFTSLVRKKEAPSPAPTARGIDLAISSFYYNPHFDYDQPSNSYLRSQAGVPHMDEAANAQIAAKAVVVLVMPHRYEGIYSVYGVNDGGTMYVFQDGTVTQGTWSKAGRKNQFVFTGADGQPLALNPGQTWISIIGSANALTYKP